MNTFLSRLALPTFFLLLLIGCQDKTASTAQQASAEDQQVLQQPDQMGSGVKHAPTPHIEKRTYPIVFITQVPTQHDLNTRLSAFANHRTSVIDVPRGGDLMLRYPDGVLRNLSAEAGLGMQGIQLNKAIAVREPSVHPNGQTILVSILIGSPHKNQSSANYKWQIYEVTQLGRNEKPRFQRVAGQPTEYNQLSPIYADNGDIIFTSDRPRTGEPHLYPQLDEYEATPSVSGIWKLNRKSGKLQLLTHTPSGAFSPMIDSFGRVLFTRWDHLQQDQLADRDRDAERNRVQLPFASFNFNDESVQAKRLNHRNEIFPESRVGSTSTYGQVNAFRSNFFSLWQVDQSGGNEETINHLGLHELNFGYLMPSFSEDPNLSKQTNLSLHENRIPMRREGGFFHPREDPLHPGTYYGINARESGSFTTDSIIKLIAPPHANPEQIRVVAVTKMEKNDQLHDGRYRNPLPLSDGRLLASRTSDQLPPQAETSLRDLRLTFLEEDLQTGYFKPTKPLTSGIRKKLSWWEGEKLRHFDGELWELEAVELRPRTISPPTTMTLERPEQAVFEEEQVNVKELQAWLENERLALIVTRNQTSRDRADRQQPFNLEIENGTKTVSNEFSKGKIYQLQHFQILQAEQIRAYPDRAGRRNLAQTIPNFHPVNKVPSTLNENLQSSVIIEKDGSTAVIVPAERALTWQTTDSKGTPVVRERNWVTFKSGEIRVCASCHGVNQRDQAGFLAPTNKPEALRELLRRWKKTSQLRASSLNSPIK
ncbi:hypothetical protein [Undibacterium fentianense]|uniref:Hydrazine synthase alpha subunit middle domain-containing protein n=1 Tax=Undibacterium fentianense TaxID=2828728 RepID=A0A941DYR1_9BURK|nr:hypothetical protein [Undibacterium fentianense]MBR7799220.1 hypothetical protein [Undibacterium fentianense]